MTSPYEVFNHKQWLYLIISDRGGVYLLKISQVSENIIDNGGGESKNPRRASEDFMLIHTSQQFVFGVVRHQDIHHKSFAYRLILLV